jgi:hypothetical protein
MSALNANQGTMRHASAVDVCPAQQGNPQIQGLAPLIVILAARVMRVVVLAVDFANLASLESTKTAKENFRALTVQRAGSLSPLPMVLPLVQCASRAPQGHMEVLLALCALAPPVKRAGTELRVAP